MNCCDCPEEEYCNPAEGCAYEPCICEPTEEELDIGGDSVTMIDALREYFGR